MIDELAAAGYSPADTFEELSSTVAELGPIAHLVEHSYRDGYGRRELDRPFHTVRCDRCGIVLNSGHHYRPEADGTPSRFALELAAEHNRDAHDVEPCQDCATPVEWDEASLTYRHHGPACYLATSSGWIVLP